MQPLVYVVILNYANYKDTLECIKSIEKVDYSNYKVIIVDNNSPNNSEQILRNELSAYKIIETGKNLGFAGGNNIAIKYALDEGAEFILLLNNDTIVSTDLISNMLNSFERHEYVGVVGGKIFYYDDRTSIWFSGGEIDWFKFYGKHYMANDAKSNLSNREREVSFITGCLMMIRSEVFKKVGLLPAEYFMYFEDVDFCVKVMENGYKLIYNPDAVIYHKVSISSGGEESTFAVKWTTRNRIIFMNKFKYKVPIWSFYCSRIFFYSTRVIKMFLYILKGQGDKAIAIIDGMKKGKNYISNPVNLTGLDIHS